MYALRIRVEIDNPNKGFICVSVWSFETNVFHAAMWLIQVTVSRPVIKKNKKLLS